MPDNPLFYVIAAAIAVVLGVVCFFLGSAYRRKADSTTIGSAEDEARKILSDNSVMYCPHGRPVAFELKKSELERQFGRTN